MKRKQYREALKPLQVELNQLARWLRDEGARVVVVLEGRDTAGKGGSIHAITRRLNPRQVRVVALPTPSEREATQWYYQRYVEHLPAAGELVLFDRSWYNRAGVERVMGFCTDAQYHAFLSETPLFERSLVRSGIILLKYWLAVDQTEQEARFAQRARDPLKRWKLSSIDLEARARYREYGQARDAMFEATHTADAPWTVIDFNDQKRGRLDLIRDLLDRCPTTALPDNTFELPPLQGEPAREEYRGPVTPLPSRYA